MSRHCLTSRAIRTDVRFLIMVDPLGRRIDDLQAQFKTRFVERLPDGFDSAGELDPEDVDLLRSRKSVHQSYEERIGLSHPPVGRADGRRMDANEDFIIRGDRFFDVFDFENVRRAVPRVDGRFHERMNMSRVSAIRGLS